MPSGTEWHHRVHASSLHPYVKAVVRPASITPKTNVVASESSHTMDNRRDSKNRKDDHASSSLIKYKGREHWPRTKYHLECHFDSHGLQGLIIKGKAHRPAGGFITRCLLMRSIPMPTLHIHHHQPPGKSQPSSRRGTRSKESKGPLSVPPFSSTIPIPNRPFGLALLG